MKPIQPPVFIRLTDAHLAESEGNRACVLRSTDIHSFVEFEGKTKVTFFRKETVYEIEVTETVDEIAAKLNVGKMQHDPDELPEFYHNYPSPESFSKMYDDIMKERAEKEKHIKPAKLTQVEMTSGVMAKLLHELRQGAPETAERVEKLWKKMKGEAE